MNFLGGTDATEADFETVSGEQAAYLSIGHRAILLAVVAPARGMAGCRLCPHRFQPDL